MKERITLKDLFESKKDDLKERLTGLSLSQDASVIRKTVYDYMNELFESEGEFRQSLTQSEDYLLQAAMSLLSAQQEMCNAMLVEEVKEEKKEGLFDSEMNAKEAMLGSAGGALVGKLLLSSWGAVFGAIAGTAVMVYLANRKEHKKDTPSSETEKGRPIDADRFIMVVSGICASVDDLIATFRAQINAVVYKYENKEVPTLDKDYRMLLESVQSLVGYSRMHGDDEKFVRKVQERINDLAETLENYQLEVVDYSEDKAAWFEKVSSPNTLQLKMVYPAIIKKGEVVLMGKVFVPSNELKN